MKFLNYRKITVTVILLSFLNCTLMFAAPPMDGLNGSFRKEMKYYSEKEVQELAEELTEAAKQAIEMAAAEAAKAAALEGLKREARALGEAQKWHGEYMNAKAAGMKNSVLGGVIGFIVGATVTGITVCVIGGK